MCVGHTVSRAGSHDSGTGSQSPDVKDNQHTRSRDVYHSTPQGHVSGGTSHHAQYSSYETRYCWRAVILTIDKPYQIVVVGVMIWLLGIAYTGPSREPNVQKGCRFLRGFYSLGTHWGCPWNHQNNFIIHDIMKWWLIFVVWHHCCRMSVLAVCCSAVPVVFSCCVIVLRL